MFVEGARAMNRWWLRIFHRFQSSIDRWTCHWQTDRSPSFWNIVSNRCRNFSFVHSLRFQRIQSISSIRFRKEKMSGRKSIKREISSNGYRSQRERERFTYSSILKYRPWRLEKPMTSSMAFHLINRTVSFFLRRYSLNLPRKSINEGFNCGFNRAESIVSLSVESNWNSVIWRSSSSKCRRRSHWFVIRPMMMKFHPPSPSRSLSHRINKTWEENFSQWSALLENVDDSPRKICSFRQVKSSEENVKTMEKFDLDLRMTTKRVHWFVIKMIK